MSKTLYIPATIIKWWPGLGELSVSFQPPFVVGMRSRTGAVFTIKGVSAIDFKNEPFGRPSFGKRMFAVQAQADGSYLYLGHERWTHDLEQAYVAGGFQVMRQLPSSTPRAIA